MLTGLVIPIDDNPLEIMVGTGNRRRLGLDDGPCPSSCPSRSGTSPCFPRATTTSARSSLFLAARDTGGKQSDVVRQEHEMRIPAADYEEAQRAALHDHGALLMEAGSYKVSVGLLDNVTRQVGVSTSVVFVGE